MSLDKTFRALRLDSGAVVTKFDTDITLAGNSNVFVPTQKAVKSYIDTAVGGSTVGLRGVLAVPLSFETGEQMQTLVYFPMKVTINRVRSTVTKAIADTDDATITCGNVTGPSTGGVITIAASSALEDDDNASPTTNNVVLANGYYYLTTAKTTAGGKALVTIEYTLTA